VSAKTCGNCGCLRDYFAAAALPAVIATHRRDVYGKRDIASIAYDYADAMIDKRNMRRRVAKKGAK
jgi:hypothetical protein